MNFIKLAVRKHPYLSVFYLWLSLLCIFGNFGSGIFNYISAAVFPLMIIPMNELFCRTSQKPKSDNTEKKKLYLIAVTAAIYLTAVVFLYLALPKNKSGWGRNPAVLFAAGMIPLISAAVFLKTKKAASPERILLLIIAAGFFLHFFYNAYTEFNNQFDLNYSGSPDETGIMGGHAGYIRYIHDNGLPLQSDPRKYWQFYHPPLHYYIEAAILKLQTIAGVDIEFAMENIKYPPLLYFMLTIVTLIKITRLLDIKGRPLIAVISIMLFSPAMIMVSNYANNDMLSIFLMYHSVYLAMLWYKDRRTANIILTALFFGLGMLAKLSAWMAAVPIAVIFISALIEKIKSKKKNELLSWFSQMLIFLLIAAPLSFYWSIRNYLRFGMSLGYIPSIESTYQHIDVPILQRIFDFSPHQFREPYVCISIFSDYNEYNPLIALLKSAGANAAYSAKSYNNLFALPNHLSLWASIILAAAGLICFIAALIKKDMLSPTAKTAFLASYITLILSYYIFALKYPEVCTENIRYATQLIFIGSFSVGIMLKRTDHTAERSIIPKLLTYCVLLFCSASVLLFTADGLWTSLYYNFL